MVLHTKRYGQVISRYADGELDDRARAQLERHLESCAACAVQLQEYRAVSSALTAPAPIQASPYLWTQVQRRLHERSAPRGFRRLVAWRPVATALAGAALIVLALVTAGQLRRTIIQSEREAAIQAVNPPTDEGTAPASIQEVSPGVSEDDTLEEPLTPDQQE